MNWIKQNWIKIGIVILVVLLGVGLKYFLFDNGNQEDFIKEPYISSVVSPFPEDNDIIRSVLDEKVLAEYGAYNFDTFAKKPQIVQRIKQLKSDFSVDEMAVSSPNEVYLLGNKRFLVLSGCVPHDCWGTGMIVVLGLDSNALYITQEKYEDDYAYYGDPKYGFAYTYWGNPSDDIKRLMLRAIQ